MSYIVVDQEGKEKILLKEAIELLGAEIVGDYLWEKYRGVAHVFQIL